MFPEGLPSIRRFKMKLLERSNPVSVSLTYPSLVLQSFTRRNNPFPLKSWTRLTFSRHRKVTRATRTSWLNKRRLCRSWEQFQLHQPRGEPDLWGSNRCLTAQVVWAKIHTSFWWPHRWLTMQKCKSQTLLLRRFNLIVASSKFKMKMRYRLNPRYKRNQARSREKDYSKKS